MLENQQTLFERVGGKQAIAELVDKFYDRVVADPELKPFFKNVSMDKIRRMQREFFSAALDGPIFILAGLSDMSTMEEALPNIIFLCTSAI